MKRILCILFLLLVLPAVVFAEGEALPPDVQQALDEPGITAEEFQQASLGEMLSTLLKTARQQFEKPVRLLVQLLGAALLGAVALALASQGDWSGPLESVCVLGMFTVSLAPALELVNTVSESVARWQVYLVSFVPVFSGVVASCGQPTQAMVYSGMFLTMANFSAQVICAAALPVLQVYLALNTAGGLCGIGGVADGCELLAKAVKWLLGLVSVLFGAVLGLQSVLAQNADTLAMKTGKFLISSSIPVVGSVASDAMGSVLSGLRVLKGSLGFAAIAVLAIDFLPILLQSAFYYLAYQLGGAVSKAFGLNRAGRVLEGMGQAIGICVSFLVFFFMLVVLSTALMITMGGGG